jgi:hypothetical protein
MNDKANERRKRGVWLGLLVVLLLALGGYAYAQSSSSPSASAGSDKGKPSATPTALPSTEVLAPTQTAKPTSPGSTGAVNLGTSPAGQTLVLAPQAAGNNGNGNGNGNGNNPCVDPASENANCPHTFGVQVGQAPLLYPGVARNLPVAFSNPNNFAIAVSSYRVIVVVPGPAATTCPASNLQVPAGTVSLKPGLAVAKKATTATTVPIKLATTAPAACQNVSFTITVNASAVKK